MWGEGEMTEENGKDVCAWVGHTSSPFFLSIQISSQI